MSEREVRPAPTDKLSEAGGGGLFGDHKSPEAMRTIGEVSAALGIRQHVLRYWEEQFPMLRPVKRSGGRRYYRPDDVELLRAIDRLVNREGYTLRGARAAIEAGAGREPAPAAPTPPALPAAGGHDPELRTALATLRQLLAEALARE